MKPNLCARDRCSGCSACANVCPRDAIAMFSDDEGFLAPRVDADKCVECGRCSRACPELAPRVLERASEPTTRACWNVDRDVRLRSSSGGMFSVYARRVLESGGAVFAVVGSVEDAPSFAKLETLEALSLARSSKYVQARAGSIYREVGGALDAGRRALFVGTPCQVAGLYGYLGGDREGLTTCDVVCFGAPSPLLYRKWLDWLGRELGGKVVSVDMRFKRDGDPHCAAIAVDARPNDPLVLKWSDPLASYIGRVFLSRIALRRSCATCSFARFPRVADITLGDFWGLGDEIPFEYPKEDGVSVNFINSEKGAALVDECREFAVWVERPLEEAKRGNPSAYRSRGQHKKREAFLRDLQTMDYGALERKYRAVFYGSWRKRLKERARRAFEKIARVLWGTAKL